MEGKDKNELRTPDAPESSSSKGKSWKPQHKKKNNGEKMAAIVSLYASCTEEIKAYIFTTGSAMNKTFLMSREKFLGYATTKFGNDITYSLSERHVLMHTPVPTAINHTRVSLYEQRQNEIEAKEFR